MGSLSIHGLEPDIERKLKDMANAENQSLNKTVKRVLSQALGQKPSDGNRAHFQRFCRRWSRQDAREFAKAMQEFQRIDPEDWK